MARGTALLALVHHDLGDIAEAEAHFALARQLDPSPMARRALWEAEHALALGRKERARELTQRNLASCRRLGWNGHVAHCHTVLGLLALEEDLARAQEHLTNAWEWARASNEVEVRLRCHELAARLALQGGKTDEALEEAEAGRILAATCGFGLFRSRLACLVARGHLAREPRGAVKAALAALDATGREDAWGRAEALEVAAAALEAGEESTRAREMQWEATVLRERLRSRT